jgi:hypothetical protein
MSRWGLLALWLLASTGGAQQIFGPNAFGGGSPSGLSGTDPNPTVVKIDAQSSTVMLISTQTANNTGSLQFTNLPATYNTLLLNCSGLLMSAGHVLLAMQVGEGTGPTWETAGNYAVTLTGSGGTSSGTTLTDLLQTVGGGDYWGSTTYPAAIKLYIDNVGSSSSYKNVTGILSIYLDGPAPTVNVVASYWAGDTNPITGIQLTASGGTIAKGTCSLYGMN